MMDRNKLISCTCDFVCKAIEQYIEKADKDLIDALKKAGFIDSSYTVKQAEKLESELTEILQGKNDEFIKLLEDNPDASVSDILDKMSEFNNSTNMTADMEKIFYNQFSSSVSHIANSYVKSIDKELELQKMTNRTSDWINTWSRELAEIMNINTEESLKTVLSRAMSNGKSVSAVAEDLVDSGTLDSTSRARTTALTEMLRANSVSAQEAYIQSPAVSQKKWRHTGARKNKPRQNHIDMDGQIVPVDEPFELVGASGSLYYPMYPRDVCLPAGESINCHCIHQPIVNGDILGLSLEEREKLQKHAINTDNKAWKKEQKEKGISGKKRDKNEVNSVDLKFIKSQKYKDKFRGITGNKKVDNRIYSQSKAMLTHRNGTDKEDLCLINSKTGKIEGRCTNAKIDFEVDYNSNLKKIIKDNPEYSLISIHNHPTNNPPTGSDIVSAGAHKYKLGVVVTHDGRVFTYKAGDKPFRAETFGKTVDKYRSVEYNLSESEAILRTLNDFKKSHGIDWSER